MEDFDIKLNLRILALDRAVDLAKTSPPAGTEDVVADAEAFYAFLVAGVEDEA